MIIDCHVNVGWDVNNVRKNLIPTGQTYNALLEKMNYLSIDKAVVIPFPSPGGQFNKNFPWYDLENHYLMEANNFSKRLIPFPAVNPGNKYSVKYIFTSITSFDIKGVKFSHQIPMGFSIDKLIKHPLMKIIEDNNLIFMIHTGTGKENGSDLTHTTLDYAIKVAKYYPDIRFIFCHLGRLHKTIFEAFELENVYMDTSALSMKWKWKQFTALQPLAILKNLPPTKVIQSLVEKGYGDKIIFGSDEPYTKQENEIEIIENSDIPQRVKRKIFYGNVSNLLRMK